MLCVRDSGRRVAKMRARVKHMAKEKVGTSSTNTLSVQGSQVLRRYVIILVLSTVVTL